MEELTKRENEIFDILQKFINNKLEFILVGGYAVSAFKHRFSVDADIVIKNSNLEDFEKVLKKEGFKRTISRELENIYSSKFVVGYSTLSIRSSVLIELSILSISSDSNVQSILVSSLSFFKTCLSLITELYQGDVIVSP